MENDENIDSQKDSAPPAGFKKSNGNFNDNNNAKLEESNYNLFPSFPNNNIINNPNNINQSQINSFQSNGNKIPQNINNPINVPNYQYYNMMNLNKMNYLNQVNYINNQMLMNRLNYFNQGNSINNKISIDNNLMIDIPDLLLAKIEKKYLIDLILFIRDYCYIKIKNKNLSIKHDLYEIKIYKSNKCTINIKDSKKKILENIEKEKDGNINKNENIINEEKKNEIKNKENNLNNKNVINSINGE